MKATFNNLYRKNGNVVLVYHVTGTTAELEMYKEAKGDNYRVDEATGKPLYYSTNRLVGNGFEGELRFGTDGQVYADSTEDTLAEMLINSKPGPVADQIAAMRALDLMNFIRTVGSMKQKTVNTTAEAKTLGDF